ncbi:hypothetical protein Cni_G21265 [Canna indica]|uniref:Glycosyltransferase 61 catalytic domain-containing protein n=1 Tax=Canna indica TaxID=4628 RepID=A0AAQ3KP63_9LILI|nr:hypothetical protein Cni_G21265 [Canna indica]
MGSKMKLVRSGNVQARKYKFAALITGFFLVTMTFLVVSKPQSVVISNFGYRTSFPAARTGSDNGLQGSHSATYSGGLDALNSQESERNDGKDEGEINDISGSTSKEEASTHEIKEESGPKSSNHVATNQAATHIALPTASNYSILEHAQSDSSIVPEKSGEQVQTPATRKPLCNVSYPRVDICDMNGDIRIGANSSFVMFVEPSATEQKEEWRVHPYARKGDQTCLNGVRQLTVKASSEGPQCTVSHDVPAVVFSIGGYTGNLFHDFSDLLVPLFTTSRQFNGEVQFIVTDWKQWWINKYRVVLQNLSNYPLIDLAAGDEQVRCFKQVTVGLRAHTEFRIDPRRAPNGYTMVDFARFMRSCFSLERETPSTIEDLAARKPRLLLIARKWSRAFTNSEEIVATAEELGYEVVVEEADVSSDLARFARIVNSCDVMMGVHGAGLTNLVFLPANATIVQIVPWGGLEGIAMLDFGNAAKDMGLNYVQYSIGMEESTLTEKYPRDHPVFTKPLSFHGRGFHVLRSTFMKQQNVKLDVKRFRGVLWEALVHLIQ